MRTRRQKQNQPKPTPSTPERNPHDDPLTPWWDKPGHNHPGYEITPPHDHCVSLETTGWHPDMTGHPATVMHGHLPRAAVIRKPCAFTRHIAVKLADTRRTVYLEPVDIFIHETDQ